MTNKFDFNLPVQTRNGRKATVLAKYARGGKTYYGVLVGDPVTNACVYEYDAQKEGKLYGDGWQPCDADLINIRPKRWVNLYMDIASNSITIGRQYQTEAEAVQQADTTMPKVWKYLKTVEVEL